MSAADVIKSLVPMSQFTQEGAAKIFNRLHSEPQLIVLKDDRPSAVILSPDEYNRLMEMEEDFDLLMETVKRLTDQKDQPALSMEEVMSELGITQEDLDNAEDVEIECTRMMKGLPFSAVSPEDKMTKTEARTVIEQLRSEAAQLPEMSLDEINAEINAARAERKAKI